MSKVIAILFTLFVLPAFAKAPPEATVYVGRGEMMTHEQFLKLNREQKKIYIKDLRTMFVQMAQKSDFFASSDFRPHLMDLFFPRAEASGDLRCMYGGFIQQTENCSAETTYGEMSCGPGLAICNPILFGDGAGQGLCVKPSRNMTQVCAQRSSAPEAIDNAVGYATNDPTTWGTLSTNYNHLCGSESDQYLRPGLSQRSRQDISRTCEWARARITETTRRVAAVPPAPPAPPAPVPPTDVTAKPVTPAPPPPVPPQPPAPVEPADPPRSLDCSGRCSVTVRDVKETGTGHDFLGGQHGKVNGWHHSTYQSDSCSIAIQSGSGGRVDMRNMPENFPDRLMSLRMKNVPCPSTLESCTPVTAHANSPTYELFARQTGNKRCELEFVAKGPADDRVFEIYDDQMGGKNAQKCMGLDRNTALSDTDPRFAAYRALTNLLASQGCDLSKIDVVKPGAEANWNGSQSAMVRDCRLRMSANIDPAAPVEIRFTQMSKGDGATISLPNLTGLTEKSLRDQLTAQKICFASWGDRLRYHEPQAGSRHNPATTSTTTPTSN